MPNLDHWLITGFIPSKSMMSRNGPRCGVAGPLSGKCLIDKYPTGDFPTGDYSTDDYLTDDYATGCCATATIPPPASSHRRVSPSVTFHSTDDCFHRRLFLSVHICNYSHQRLFSPRTIPTGDYSTGSHPRVDGPVHTSSTNWLQ